MSETNIVFLPALMCDERLYAIQLKELTKIISKQIAVHIFVIKDIPDIEDAALFVIDKIQKLENKKCHVIGTSMGGYIAMEMLRQAPEMIEKMCLINTSWNKDTPDRAEAREAIISQLENTDDDKFIGINDEIIKSYLHDITEEKSQFITKMVEDIGRTGFVAQQKLALSRKDYRDLMCNTSVPALVIGAEFDAITPPTLHYEMAKNIPNSKLYIIDKCSHFSPIDQPYVVSQLINKWIEEN